MNYRFGIVLLAVCTLGLKPFQKEAEKDFNEGLASSIEATNKSCGVKIPVKADFNALKAEEWEGQSIYSRCEAVLYAIDQVCQKEAYKEELVKRIKEVHCFFGGKDGDDNAKTKANMSVTKGAFVYKMHPSNVNLSDNATEVIQKALNE